MKTRGNILPRFAGVLHLAMSQHKVRLVLESWIQNNPGKPIPIGKYDMQAISFGALRPEIFKELPKHFRTKDGRPNMVEAGRFSLRIQLAKTREPELAMSLQGALEKVREAQGIQADLRRWWAVHGIMMVHRQANRIQAKSTRFATLSPADLEGRDPAQVAVNDGRFTVNEILELAVPEHPIDPYESKKILKRLRQEIEAAEQAIQRFWPDQDL